MELMGQISKMFAQSYEKRSNAKCVIMTDVKLLNIFLQKWRDHLNEENKSIKSIALIKSNPSTVKHSSELFDGPERSM